MIDRANGDLKPAPPGDFKARAGEGYSDQTYSMKIASISGEFTRSCRHRFRTFPTISSFPEGRRVPPIGKAGFIHTRLRVGLGRVHYEVIRTLLSSNVGSRRAGVYHQDQVSLALAVQKLQLKHSELHPRMNYNLNMRAKKNADIIPIPDVQVLQYHGLLNPIGIEWAMGYVEQLSRIALSLFVSTCLFRQTRFPNDHTGRF